MSPCGWYLVAVFAQIAFEEAEGKELDAAILSDRVKYLTAAGMLINPANPPVRVGGILI